MASSVLCSRLPGGLWPPEVAAASGGTPSTPNRYDETRMSDPTWISVLPPVLAIVLAIWTRQVYLSHVIWG